MFFISEKEKNIKIIINEDKTWQLYFKNGSYQFLTIYELMRKLYFLIEK